MAPNESASIKAIELTKAVFESIHGNFGLLKFNIEQLIPTNGTNGENSKKWQIICSFFETLGSTAPTRYKIDVNLNNNTISMNKLDGSDSVKRYTVQPTLDNQNNEQ